MNSRIPRENGEPKGTEGINPIRSRLRPSEGDRCFGRADVGHCSRLAKTDKNRGQSRLSQSVLASSADRRGRPME